MEIIYQKAEKSEIVMKISVSAAEQKKYLEKAAKKISLEKSIDGFRPGKAPYQIVERRFGAMAIMEKALPEIVEKAYVEAVKKEKYEPIGSPEISMEKVAPNNPVVFSAKFSILPSVSLGDYKKIKVSRKKVEVDEKKLEKAMEELRRMQHKEAIADREANDKDKVVVDIDMYKDKVPIDGGQTKSHQIYLKDEYFIPGFKEKVYGMKKNEVKEFVLPFPKEHYNKHLAGQEVEFRVTLKEVYQIDLPELNDEFAKSLKFETLKDLKEQIKKNLLTEAQQKEDQRVEVELIEEILKITRVEQIPQMLLENEVKKMIEELRADISRQGMDFEEYLKNIKKTADDLKIDFLEQAAKRIKIALLTKQFAQEGGIGVSDEEFVEEYKKLLKTYEGDEKSLEHINSESYRNYLRTLLTNRKVIEKFKKECIKE